jgi:protein-S-isoprenylcysteine O-methyltransferase Ste14
MKKWQTYILTLIWGPLLIAQIVLVLIFGKINSNKLDALFYLGWLVWLISVVFGWLPILVLKRKGGVPKGKTYVHTQTLVTTNIYSIVRHPQYTAGLLFSLALVLISQTWLITILGAFIILFLYLDILIADRIEIEKFGDLYRAYMQQVPRTNFLLGIVRLLRNQKKL